MRTEIVSLEELDRHLKADLPLAGAVFKALDLRDRDTELAAQDLTAAVMLGCRIGAGVLATSRRQGVVVFPVLDGLPFDAYRTRLYTVEDLYGGFRPDEPGGYLHTLDAVIDEWARERRPPDVLEALCQRLHDHAITTAIDELVAGRRVAGVMGGHDLRRDDPQYAAVAGLGRGLQRAGLLVATGGGPGAMEAANLGALLGPHPDDALAEALTMLAVAPVFAERDQWLAAGMAVRDRWLVGGGESLGIPTWHYGHEPPTPFATHIGKYFENSVREHGLLTVTNAGIVFTAGGSGTAQELFQDASQNCYAAAGQAAPMVLFGVDFWTEQLGAVKPLRFLARGREAGELITVTDDPAEALAAIAGTADRP